MSARKGIAHWPPRQHGTVSLPRPPDWTELAVCAEVDSALFFPDEEGSSLAAIALCRSCEVRAECLASALERGDRYGIFGGFSERARLRVAREHAAGQPLEDIIVADDAAFYARLERSAGLARASAERQRARDREKSAAARAVIAARQSGGTAA